MLENQVSQQEVAGLVGSTVRDVMSKPYGSQRAKLAVSQQLLKIAENFDADASHKREREREHMRAFDCALRMGIKFMPTREREVFDRFQQERRDMSDAGGGAYAGSANGFFVPVMFEQQCWQMAKQVDRLFDPDVVSFITTDKTTDKAGPMSIPNLDDTASAASVLAQGQSQSQQEPETLGQLSFGITPVWASGLWKVSKSLMADSGISIVDLFASTSATRFRRGIGKAFVATLLGTATLGAIANGSASNDGTGGPNTVSTDDLHALLQSLDEEYLASPKARWLMNFKTYQTLLIVKDRQGRPVLQEQYHDAGEPMLLGRPIAISPSMPSMSPTFSSPQQSVSPIAVGDLGRFIVRVVGGGSGGSGGMRIVRMEERWAEYFQVGFESFVRADAGLMVTPGSDSPVKYLQTAA